ncbi:hypothetical protein SLH46_03170 [Draconibacterium sp. IB214405]|uniref:hypothetical protein n=1 Tax=Draconibacterium sp. IB214405 TaxID=3097352 RepID=UPI002A14305B|nr:hypothetical protein [Draconibacterium sp. IB214405]MDX8338169.1 hypothetical protein [Draconibacterium sp. IB214405]
MKKSFVTIFTTLSLFLFLTNFASAQETTIFGIHRNIELKNESQTKEVKIEMNEKECRFNLRINSVVRGGEVTIEIYNPNGKKQGNFSVGCEIQSDHAQETVNGQISKFIDNPELGDWKILIIPKNAEGKVTIEFTQDVIKTSSN